ncbi:MAG: SulP family inorganic anion transporter, partial [Salinimicrobium sp.]
IQQIPYVFGYDKVGAMEAGIKGGVFSSFGSVFSFITPGALIVTLISLIILLLWEKVLGPKNKIFQLVPGPVVAVLLGVFYQLLITDAAFGIPGNQLVAVPVPEDAASFIRQFSFPNFSMLGNSEIWIVAATLAVVASLETLLSVEAVDKLDPRKRVTPTNRELFAQGAGNVVSGLIGGLPVTQVIVRSSANVQSGGRSKLSAILHGFFILISIMLIPALLNMIPLAVLAAVLLLVGYKLAKPSLFRNMVKLGKSQFLPFIITVLGVVFLDLLMGIGLGLLVGVSVILLNSYKNSHFLHIEDVEGKHTLYKMTLAEEISFLNKGAILKELHALPDNSTLQLDVRKTRTLDYDVLEILDEFAIKAKNRNINIKLISQKGEVDNPQNYRGFFGLDIPVA